MKKKEKKKGNEEEEDEEDDFDYDFKDDIYEGNVETKKQGTAFSKSKVGKEDDEEE